MSENIPPRICAVVVSFNRKELLLRCLDTLVIQTRPVDQIIVVDNASTDGTEQLVREHGFFDRPNFQFHALPENMGGAGGFRAGVELGYQQGYDWLWLMDDDGFARENTLEDLLQYQQSYDFYGPIVLDDQTRKKLSFPIRYPGTKKVLRTLDEIPEANGDSTILEDVLIPFNGVLLRRSLVEKIEFPDARFFIWGDDMEYTYRARKQGARIATIVDIPFFHPTAPALGTPMFFGMMQFNDTDSNLKLYCLCRNNTYNLKKYRGVSYAFAFVLKTCWFYTLTSPSARKLKLALGALKDGWTGRFGKHKKYIPGNA